MRMADTVRNRERDRDEHRATLEELHRVLRENRELRAEINALRVRMGLGPLVWTAMRKGRPA